MRILETIRNRNPKIKFYQASSSEMFGDVLHKTQNEKTPFNPQSPYAISKLFGIILRSIIEILITFLQFQEYYLIMSLH